MLNEKELSFIEHLEPDEKAIVKWQYGVYGGFFTALFNAIREADDFHLSLLEQAFPAHAGGYRKFSREEGWWPRVEEKLKEIAEMHCDHRVSKLEVCGECEAEKVDACLDEVKHGDRSKEGKVL